MNRFREKQLEIVHDEKLIEYFYLRQELEEVVEITETLCFSKISNNYDIPFNAAVKGYHGLKDCNDHTWIIKPITSDKEALFHRIAEIVYFLDFEMGTLSAPTMVITLDGKRYRATKVVPNAMQISSYNYMENPFKNILLNDLINRWLTFDEDRNPNNYMVIHNSRSIPLVAAIDFDKADLENKDMKITGTDDHFGWIRHEKNRYLTLYKTENFHGLYIDLFEDRLQAMMAIDLQKILKLGKRIFEGYCEDPEAKAREITDNIGNRRSYIDKYFRTWFKAPDESKLNKEMEANAGFGQTLMKKHHDSR